MCGKIYPIMTNQVTSFKLMTESLGLPVAKAARLLRVPTGTAQKWASGERTVPREVMRAMEEYWRQVDEVARALRDRPELLHRAMISRNLHRAVRRRIQEINISQACGVRDV